MNLQSRRGSAVIRQVLKEVINDQHPSSKRYEELEKAKLNEVILFLQKKIDRQHSEIKIISEQLSKEISLKQELLFSLNEEKQKNHRLSQHLATANRSNHELKNKLVKSKIEASCEQKQDFQMKINKYREIVRKKDQFLMKNQQKLQELMSIDRNFNQLERDLKTTRQSYAKLKQREQNLSSEVQKLKQKLTQANEKLKQQEQALKQKQWHIHEQKQKILIYEQHMKRLTNQYNDLFSKHQQTIENYKTLEQNTHKIIASQIEQIQKLSQRILQPISLEQAKWDLNVYKKEARRCLESLIKDTNLRRKIQKEINELLCEVEKSFSKVMGSVFEIK